LKCLRDETSAPKEWCLIELQGDLEVEKGQSLVNKFMGDLHFNKEVFFLL
jgi:hypothetical protein